MTLSPFVPVPQTQQEEATPIASHNNGGHNGDHSDSQNGENNLTAQFSQINQSISAVSAATYCWDIASDQISWNGKLEKVFGPIKTDNVNNGRSYASLLDPDNFTSRFETVMRNTDLDNGNGVPFSIEYSIKPLGRDNDHSIWVEDMGRWYAGQDGRPAKVYGLVRQIDDRHERDQHLQFMGNCDPLTGMMNRGRLTEALGETIESARAQDHLSAFLIVAIANLEVVNDAYGFDVADEVVTSIGKRLRQVVRTGDVIGRYSGSKFGIILSQATQEELEIAAERFLSIAREQVIETDLGPVWASLSIGGLTVPYLSDDAPTTMSHAEEALAEAKKLPTDGFVSFEPSKDVESERKLNSRCAVEIVRSLKDNRFTLAYQPIFNVHTQEIEYYEALLRMKSEDGELIPAGHLVPIAEKIGLIRLIDRAVVSNVLTTLRRYPTTRIALNISGVTANDPRWFEKLTDILSENNDLTDRLTIEITETVALENIEQTIGFIQKLHELGCKVAIDDFGAGFTSFRNLKLLNVDKVKIDGSFCVNLSNNPENQYFVKTLIDLAKNFNLLTVAEWVENQEDADLLTSWGVDYLQGELHGMAQDCAQWGEPVNEADDVCVVPSEIFVEDDNQLDIEKNEQTSEPQDPVFDALPLSQDTDETSTANTEPFMAEYKKSSDIPFAAFDSKPMIEANSDDRIDEEQPNIQAGFASIQIDQTLEVSPFSDQDIKEASRPFTALSSEMVAPFQIIPEPSTHQDQAFSIPDVAIDQDYALTPEPSLKSPQESSTPKAEAVQTEEASPAKASQECTNEEETAAPNSELQANEPAGTPIETQEDNAGIISESQLDDELRKLREAIKNLGMKAKPELKEPVIITTQNTSSDEYETQEQHLTTLR